MIIIHIEQVYPGFLILELNLRTYKHDIEPMSHIQNLFSTLYWTGFELTANLEGVYLVTLNSKKKTIYFDQWGIIGVNKSRYSPDVNLN